MKNISGSHNSRLFDSPLHGNLYKCLSTWNVENHWRLMRTARWRMHGYLRVGTPSSSLTRRPRCPSIGCTIGPSRNYRRLRSSSKKSEASSHRRVYQSKTMNASPMLIRLELHCARSEQATRPETARRSYCLWKWL